jgi:hypothetical protein
MNLGKKEKCMVLIESWQIQCCGEPFKIGDNIKWSVTKWMKDLEAPLTDIDYCYENHGGNGKPLFELTGLVKKIKALYYKHETRIDPKNNCEIGYRIYEKTVEIVAADGWEKDIDGLKFGDYVVVLQDYSIRSK